MINNKKIVVIMPAYNAEATLRKTYDEVMACGIVDSVVIVDDASHDQTFRIADSLPQTISHRHKNNTGYGGNQKSCYKIALREGADIIIMVHPDYQYTPKLIPAMASLLEGDLYHCVLGSRILGGYALKGGMPLWKYIANRALTFFENILLDTKLSEFHTGYRAYSRELLEKLPLHENSNDFVFDNQILAQIAWFGYQIAEISCPTKYFPEASSINFIRSVRYGLGCMATAVSYRLAKINLITSPKFPNDI